MAGGSVYFSMYGNPILGGTNSVREGNLEIAINVTAQAKELAPVDLGQLRNSIMYKTPLKKGGFNDSEGKRAVAEITPIPLPNEAYVGANTEYAPYQEFGTRKMAPQPYLRPAIEIVAKGHDALDVLKKISDEQMRGALKKGQKRETF